MGERGRLVSEISIKYEGDLFHLCLFPYKYSQIVPRKIESVDLLAGRWGTVGSVLYWTFILGGIKRGAKEIIEAIDEEKKSITYKVIGGDVMKLYNELKVIYEIDRNNINGSEDNLITYTIEYEKKGDQVQDPTLFMDFLLDLAKDIDGAQLTS